MPMTGREFWLRSNHTIIRLDLRFCALLRRTSSSFISECSFYSSSSLEGSCCGRLGCILWSAGGTHPFHEGSVFLIWFQFIPLSKLESRLGSLSQLFKEYYHTRYPTAGELEKLGNISTYVWCKKNQNQSQKPKPRQNKHLAAGLQGTLQMQ